MRQKSWLFSNFILFGHTQYDYVQTNSLEEASASLLVTHHDRTRIAILLIGWLLGGLLMIFPLIAHAQPWSGILNPYRATDWSSPGVSGGISDRTTICATLNPGVSASQINDAISSCPSEQVVLLNAGTYDLSSGVTFGSKSDVTLRGAGADQTFLKFSNGSSCDGLPSTICIRSDYVDNEDPPNSTAWTAGYPVGTTIITVDNISGMKVGGILILDQLDDSSDSGNIFVCSITSCTDEGGNSPGRNNRSQQQLVKVVAINGNQVTINPGLRMPNWRLSQSPGVFWNVSAPIVTGNGVENLSIDVTSATDANGIVFMHVSDAWVKGVRIINPGRSHIWLFQSMQITVRDNYFYGGQGDHSTSYGIEDYSTGDNLVENNIFQHVTAPLSHNGSNTGSVFGYNFAIDDNYTAEGNSPEWMIPSVLYHEVGISHLLHEGNDGLGALHDAIHGTTHFNTLFRNHFYGDMWNSPAKSHNTEIIHVQSYGRFFNIIGNVLGRVKYYNMYEGNHARAIYNLGDSPEAGVPDDPQVRATMMRWGNYDTVTATVRFLATEVPTSISQYANSMPTDQSLPVSFYLSEKPSWFGAIPWPAIGPDVTGGQHTAGRAYKIPARVCWEQGAIDPAYGDANVRLFKPDVCYESVTSGLSDLNSLSNPRLLMSD
jgi:hypothetical protein